MGVHEEVGLLFLKLYMDFVVLPSSAQVDIFMSPPMVYAYIILCIPSILLQYIMIFRMALPVQRAVTYMVGPIYLVVNC